MNILRDPMPLLIQGDARHLPLADESVDLVVTSPPYWSLRSYSDNGEYYTGQIGSEPTWQGYLDNLIECTREMMRVLKPSGSIWLNLGDKYNSPASGQNGTASTSLSGGRHDRMKCRGKQVEDTKPKSLMLLPHRYAIRCTDELGLIVRQDQVWHKTSHLPESVTDRTCRAHEYLFHMVKQPRYYSAVDEIRESHVYPDDTRHLRGGRRSISPIGEPGGNTSTCNPLGKLPGSVWSIPSQPLNVPDHISHTGCCDGQKRDGCENGLDHYAAFPYALVRPVILGWSPRHVCTACGQGRRPVVAKTRETYYGAGKWRSGKQQRDDGAAEVGWAMDEKWSTRATISSYACDCPDTAAPTTPGVVLDPFGGTGSAALVAAMNGRAGISIDASWDYQNIIARWRIHDPKERARAAGLDPDSVARIQPVAAAQGSLWDDTA